MSKITIKLDEDKAEQISILFYNLFIGHFFEFSEALDKFMNFDDLLKMKNLMIDLKASIDVELDKRI